MIFRTGFAQSESVKGGNIYSSNFIIDDTQRNFTYYIPLNYDLKGTYPTIIFLHAKDNSSRNVIRKFGNTIHALADTLKCIIIYPDAVNGKWNTGMNAANDSINDVGFISILIDYFCSVYNSDPNRVYVAGWQNGGEMAYRLGCDLSSKITAITTFVSDASDEQELTMKCVLRKNIKVLNITGNKNQEAYDIIRAIQFFMPQLKQ